jgi:Tetratricopeptide repeat
MVRPRSGLTFLEILVVVGRRACGRLTNRLGDQYLEIADDCLRQNQPEQAVNYLKRILKLCPESSQAQTAQLFLAKLQPPLAGQLASTKKVLCMNAPRAG